MSMSMSMSLSKLLSVSVSGVCCVVGAVSVLVPHVAMQSTASLSGSGSSAQHAGKDDDGTDGDGDGDAGDANNLQAVAKLCFHLAQAVEETCWERGQ